MDWSRREMLVAGGAATLVSPSAQAAFAPAHDLKALLIGIDDYANARPLRNAVEDARGVSARLQAIGYDVSIVENATIAKMRAALASFAEGLTPATSSFVYFAGHGFQLGGASYLLPSDARTDNREAAMASAVSVVDMLQSLLAAGPRQCISIIDACRVDPRFQVPTSTIGLASIDAPGGFLVGFSAGTGQFALDGLGEGDRSRNSVFTRELLTRLDAEKSIDEILRDTRHRVSKLAASVGHAQTPALFDQTSQRLRLDGKVDDSAVSATTATAVQLRDAAALIIAVDGLDFETQVSEFPGTVNDAEYIANAMKSLGVEPNVLINPTLADVQQAIAELASGPEKRALIYLATPGGFDGSDGFIYVRESRMVAWPVERKDALFYADIVAPFQKATDKELFIFADTGLIPRESLIRSSRTPYLRELVFGPWSGNDYNEISKQGDAPVAILSSCGLYQGGFDLAERAVNSPFALAMDNALARPGLRLDELHAVVRETVETLTGRTQTPVLIANGPIRAAKLVELT
jgi:Caspase domain